MTTDLFSVAHESGGAAPSGLRSRPHRRSRYPRKDPDESHRGPLRASFLGA